MFSQKNLVELNECLACGSKDLVLTLDLGNQPLANSYKKSPDEKQDEFPLAINRCKHCNHVQLTHVVNPELMFKNYLYVSGTSKTMDDHFEWFSRYTNETYHEYAKTYPYTVLDIGCNDGSQLNHFKKLGLTTYGVDPALNLYSISSQQHKVFPTFFDKNLVSDINSNMDIIIAQNAFAHNYNQLDFLLNAKELMGKDSLLFIQTSQANMILNNEFDTIYHEHISFYNINSMNELCKRAGLYLTDVTKCPLHGTSYIFIISNNPVRARPANIENLIAMERSLGLLSDSTYVKYAERCKQIVTDLQNEIDKYQQEDWIVVGYGAAAKGMTLLNWSKVKLNFIVDDNPLKQGLFTPGTNIPIVSNEYISKYQRPILFVPLAWNFYDEIVKKIKSVRNNQNDKFCTYFPEVKTEQ